MTNYGYGKQAPVGENSAKEKRRKVLEEVRKRRWQAMKNKLKKK